MGEPVPAVPLAGGTGRRSGAGRRRPWRRGVSRASEPLDVRLPEQRLVGHVQADHRDREAAPEDDPRRLRIHPDVELRGRRPVSLTHGAAHQAHVRDLRRHAPGARQQQGRDVGQRARRDQGDGLGRRLQRGAQELQRALGPDLRYGLRQVRAVQAGRPVDLGGDLEGSRQRAPRAPPPPARPLRPSSARIRRALRVVWTRRALPPTVVMPRTSSSGRASARVIASASSCPGSQSSRSAGTRPVRPSAQPWSYG